MISIKKIEYFLFVCLAFAAYFLPAEIVFVISFLALIIAQGKGYRRQEALRNVKLPLLLLLIGCINAYQNESYQTLKDFYYFLSPVLIFCFGYLYSYYSSLNKLLKTIVILGVIMGLVYIAIFLVGGDYDSVADRKGEEGLASYLSVLALFILFIKRKNSFFPKPLFLIFVIILLFACVVSQSRTFVLVFFLLMIFGTGILYFDKYFVLKFAAISMLIAAVIVAIYTIDTTDRSTFAGKMRTSFEEVMISDYSNKADMYSHWRGYEAYIGWKQIQKGELFEWFVGQGFGATAPLGYSQELGESTFQEIPKFHNGYISIILKTGLLGFLIFILFFFKLIFSNLKDKTEINQEYHLAKNLTIGASAVILATTTVISGWLNPSATFSFIFILGFAINYKNLILKDPKIVAALEKKKENDFK